MVFGYTMFLKNNKRDWFKIRCYYKVETISVVKRTIEDIVPDFSEGETSVIIVFIVHFVCEVSGKGSHFHDQSNWGSCELFGNSTIVQGGVWNSQIDVVLHIAGSIIIRID